MVLSLLLVRHRLSLTAPRSLSVDKAHGLGVDYKSPRRICVAAEAPQRRCLTIEFCCKNRARRAGPIYRPRNDRGKKIAQSSPLFVYVRRISTPIWIESDRSSAEKTGVVRSYFLNRRIGRSRLGLGRHGCSFGQKWDRSAAVPKMGLRSSPLRIGDAIQKNRRCGPHDVETREFGKRHGS